MSEADDALRDMAANRGCRLRKSRRRKPGGDFGRFGLVDTRTGKEVFGFGKKGLTATAEEIEAFLRGDSSATWKRSLGGTKPGKRAPKAKPARARAAPKPKKLEIREARPRDAEAINALIAALGYEVTAPDIKRRLASLRKSGMAALVADQDGIVGCLTWHVTPVLHRPRPVGRITMMVVAEAARGGGIGTALVGEAAARLKAAGCGLAEVTSNVKRLRAHAFYERLGFERTSYRFAKEILRDA